MATSVKSEQPESGDKKVFYFAEPPQGLEGFRGIQDTDTSPENKLDKIEGGDAKKKAKLVPSPDKHYGDEVRKEGDKPRRDT